MRRLQDAGILVSLFLDPEGEQIAAAHELGAAAVELHTGKYALARQANELERELQALRLAAQQIVAAGMTLHAGHGLTYRNVRPIATIPQMDELNIGHSIVARALMVGFQSAVREMKELIQ
jgi:pyridoxine 5-phosphate synthase